MSSTIIFPAQPEQILKGLGKLWTSLGEEDRPRWDKEFGDLGTCLSIDCASITADDLAVVAPGD